MFTKAAIQGCRLSTGSTMARRRAGERATRKPPRWSGRFSSWKRPLLVVLAHRSGQLFRWAVAHGLGQCQGIKYHHVAILALVDATFALGRVPDQIGMA